MPKDKIKTLAQFDADYTSGRSWLVGIDEAGRGALAGPVCAGAAAISAKLYKSPELLAPLAGLDDSKKLSSAEREKIYKSLEALKNSGLVDFEAAFASVEEIEKENILNATQIAMSRACAALNQRLGLRLMPAGTVATLFGESTLDLSLAEVLIDGKPMKKFAYMHRAIVKGDASSLAIAAASIVAKVSRDRFMEGVAAKYPKFGFELHKGYGTPAHMQALLLFGAQDIHRPSFLKKLRSDNTPAAQAELW